MIGYIKHQYSYKNVGFDVAYFLTMNMISGVIGLLSAVAIKELGMTFFDGYFTPAIAFVIGYAGGDFLENIYKIVLKKPSLYSFPKKRKE